MSDYTNNINALLESDSVVFLNYAHGCMDGVLNTKIVYHLDLDYDYEIYILYSLAVIYRTKELGYDWE